MPKRLFIGLELPSSSRTMLAALDPHIKGLRWLPADQMHLTLSFLGQVEAEQEETLRTALATVRVPPFFLPIQGIGTFGGARPAIVWAGTGKDHPHLFALHKHIQDALLHAGLEPDLKPFHPHITLARAKDVPRQALRPFLHRYENAELDLLPVTAFVLFSSVLTPEGATHTVDSAANSERLPLGGSDPCPDPNFPLPLVPKLHFAPTEFLSQPQRGCNHSAQG